MSEGAGDPSAALTAEPAQWARKVRVGVLLGGEGLCAWEATMLRRIRESSYAELAVIVRQGGVFEHTDLREPPALPTPAHTLVGGVLRAIYRVLETKIICDHDAFAVCDDPAELADIPRFEIDESAISKFSADVNRIVALDLDVWVHLGGPLAGASIKGLARYGVWRLMHGDWPGHDAVATGFWPVCTDSTVIESILLADQSESLRALARSVSGTNRFSVTLNRSALYWKTSSLLPRKLEELHRRGAATVLGLAQGAWPAGPAPRVPDNVQLAVHVARNIRRRAWDFFYRHFALDRWILLAHAGEEPCTSGHEFRKIMPPKDRFWADPHVVHKGDFFYVFVEELLFATGKGHISVMVLDQDGTLVGSPIKVLERDYHLSYPCIFSDGENFFMIPESSENRTVDLYRCTDFPFQWEHVTTLLKNIAAVDATVVQHQGRWWLFAAVRENEGASYCEELFLFHACSLFETDWTPHPANPVVSDVRTARPAGAMFRRNGELYRPAQDCSRRYGYAIKLKHVTTLTTTEYAETTVADMPPDWDSRIMASHTYAYTPGMTIIDALQPRLKL